MEGVIIEDDAPVLVERERSILLRAPMLRGGLLSSCIRLAIGLITIHAPTGARTSRGELGREVVRAKSALHSIADECDNLAPCLGCATTGHSTQESAALKASIISGARASQWGFPAHQSLKIMGFPR